MTASKVGLGNKVLVPVCSQALRQWGYSAFARHCAKLGIPFEDCYEAVFGKEPRTILVQVDTGRKL